MKKPRIKFKKGDKVWVPAIYEVGSHSGRYALVKLTKAVYLVYVLEKLVRRRKP